MEIGKRIRKMRDRRGLSLRQLEELSGVSRGLISKIENAERPRVSMDVGMRLAKALGVTLDYLAGMYDDESELEPAGLALVGA